MDQDSPERKQEMMEALNRMSEKLVRLGYAKRVACHNATEYMQILWTPRGIALQTEISRIFESVNAGDRFEFDELQAFMVLLAMKPRKDI